MIPVPESEEDIQEHPFWVPESEEDIQEHPFCKMTQNLWQSCDQVYWLHYVDSDLALYCTLGETGTKFAGFASLSIIDSTQYCDPRFTTLSNSMP